MSEELNVKLLRGIMNELNKALDELRESKSRGYTEPFSSTGIPGLKGSYTIIKTTNTRDSSTKDEMTWDEYLKSFNNKYLNEEYWESAGKLSSNWDWEDDAQSVYDDLLEILIGKQKDYGPDNIRLAPGGPLNGLRVRLYDKIARLSNLIDTGATPENESLRDTFIDIANYGVIGIMILDDTFPKSKDV